MFKHGRKSEFVCYSVNEKIKYYKSKLNSKTMTEKQTEYAKQRLAELTELKARTFSEPELIITDDKKFGDGISKPRLCTVIDTDDKGRVLVVPVVKRTVNTIILDNDHSRQLGEKRRWIDRSDIYETKYLSGVKPLTSNDKAKIKIILRKK